MLTLSALTGGAAAADKKPAAPPEERFLEATPETLIPIQIGKGKKTQARLSLDANNAVHLSYADAERLGVTGSSSARFDYHDKSLNDGILTGNYSTELLDTKRDIAFYWPKKKPVFDVPTTIGPEALGVDFLSVKLAAPKADEQTFALKLIFFSKIHTGWNSSIGTLARIGDQTVAIHFEPSEDKSYALGTVGRRVAVALGGHYVEQPEIPAESNRHAKNPDYRIRKMTMGTPSVLGSLGINGIYILDSEGADGKVIPDRIRTGEDDKAYGIVVDAMKREPRHRSYPAISLGRDNLSQCSNISFDFAKELIYLTCAPHGQLAPVQLSPVGAFVPAKKEPAAR